MADHNHETIATRFTRLNQLIVGKSNYNLPKKYLVHRDGLLDVLFALYEECSVDCLRKDKHIAAFVDKFKGVMIELKSLRVNLKDFEVKKIIGRGHFGEVQVVREKATGDVYAMKVLRKQETLSQKNMAFYEEERDIMAKSTSPWLTKLQYAFQDNQNLYLVMEFHPGGDMLSLLEKYDNVLPEEMCQFYLAELVLAIQSLHSMGYVHRDIKPDNILIDRTGHIKLADFGSSSKLNSHKQVTSSMPVGTPDYVAPEVLTAMNAGPASSKSYGVECDWWSLGIVTYEMVFGSTPFTNEKLLITYSNIMNFKKALKFPPEASHVSDKLIDLIKNLLQDPVSRFGYSQLIMHSLFTDVDWNNIRHTAPPFVPTVTSVDDTSNFDDFEPENRHFSSELNTRREFSGKNLPFVGFTYTSPFETLVERLSSDESRTFSPNTSLTEVDAGSRRKEISSLQQKILQLSSVEESLKQELNNLNNRIQKKDSDIESIKSEKSVLEQMVVELRAEIKQVKQVLSFEREHRVITEKKAYHLVRCMKSRQKQDAIRLKAKSHEYDHGDSGQQNIEDQLGDALQKLDECIKEKTDLLEELHDTKHVLLECQQKLYEKEEQLLLTSSSNVSSDSCSSNCNCNNTFNNVNQDITKRLISKLEKKNVALETELEVALNAKKKAQYQADALKDVIAQLEKKMEGSETENWETTVESDAEKTTYSIKKCQEDLTSKLKCSIAELQEKLSKVEKTNEELKEKLSSTESDLLIYKDIKNMDNNMIISLQEKISALEKESSDNLNSNCNTSPKKPAHRNSSPVKSIRRNSSLDKSVLWEKKSGNEKQDRILIDSDLKQENEILKGKIEELTQEVKRLKDVTKSTEELTKKLKEMEDALSDAKLDLRVSTRKEQQTESISSSLRERNKDLREKLKASEEMVSNKTKALDDLKDQMKALESELVRVKSQVERTEKAHQIEKAKLEERIKTLRDTWENSKDLNEKFAKTQGQYEEISKQNSDLAKECNEKDKKINDLVHENKTLKTELSTKQKECNKYYQVNGVLKSSCIDLEEDLKDFEILVESREKTIADLSEDNEKLLAEVKKLKEVLKNADSGVKKEEKEKEDLLKHISELTQEMDNQNYLHETEMQNLQGDLSHYKNVVLELEEQAAHWQKELSLLDNNSKGSSERIMTLESQLCVIKEEASRHITQISSLKASNLKLTQALDDALANQQEAQKSIDDLYNELESVKAKYNHEKVKLQETVSQQTKLIDFLQSKTENMEKKKRPNISRLFGKKENIPQVPPPRDLEKLLETERSRCRRLQDQLSQTRAEKMALQGEINALKSVSTNAEVPVSPVSRAMHKALTFSPNTQSEIDSPVLSSKDLLGRIAHPAGMKHKIPHRFVEVISMRSTKCCTCLDSIHFGRPVARCQDCGVVSHPKCSTSLPSTCGLPSGFMQHFRSAVEESTSEESSSQCHDSRSEGWIKLPKTNKQGWEKRYLRLMDDVLYVFEDDKETDEENALIEFDFGSGEAKIAVTSAVSATELPYAATCDLPYVLKLESFPYTTCWPQRSLYIMTMNFQDKQMWVSVLEKLSEKHVPNQVEELHNKNKLSGKSIWTLKGDTLIDPLCSMILDENVILLGAVEGLYVLKIVNKYICSLQEKIEPFSSVYQIACMKKIGILILIHGEERQLSVTNLSAFESKLYGSSKNPIALNSVADIKGCHLFAVEEVAYTDAPYICIATTKCVMLSQWDSASKTFYSKKVIETKEPCSCIHFTPKSIIFGTDVFYELSLGSYSCKNFLDGKDATLAGLVYAAPQFRSYPVAIFQISMDKHIKEYLLCFHEMGVFVNGYGQRTRSDDLKWSRLPLYFAFQSPYLFITHFTSLEVIEISPQNSSEAGIRASMFVRNPQYMGPAHVDHSILISSTQNRTMELMVIEGSSIGRSDFQIQDASDDASIVTYTGSSSSAKGSVGESDAADLDFSFNTSVEHSSDRSLDRSSISSKASTDSVP